MTRFLVWLRLVAMTTAVVGPLIATQGVVGQSSRQQEIDNLRREQASLRTRIAAADSVHREAQVAVAEALALVDRRDNVHAAAKGSMLLKKLGPLGAVLNFGVSAVTKFSTTYDRILASINTGRWTTTRTELERIKQDIEMSKVDAVAPLLRRLREVNARLQQLGVNS